MKTIAVPLLLAGSARAQAKRQAMMQDYEVPKPILIASSWTDQVCTDTNVEAKLTALTAAQGALATLETEAEPLYAAVTTKVAEKKTAVDAVIAKEVAMKTAVAGDDTAQQLELTLKSAADQAAYNLATATATAAQALTDKTAADNAVTAATTVQTAMNTAATSAASHYSTEQGETASLTTDRNTAEGDYNTENALIANLATLKATAQTEYNTAKSDWDTKVTTKAWTNAVKTKMDAAKVTSAGDIFAGEAGSAKALEVAQSALTVTAKGNLDTKSALWDAKAKLTVAAFTPWIATDYAELQANNGCKTSTASTTVSAGHGTVTLCEGECDKKLKWLVSSDMPGQKAVPTGDTYCFGISWKADASECLLQYETLPVAGDGGDITKQCKIRKSSQGAEALFDANVLSTTTATLYTEMDSEFTTWLTSQKTTNDKVGLLGQATKYDTELGTLVTAAGSASGTADSEYTTSNGTLTTKQADLTTATTNHTDKETLIAAKLAAWESLKTQVTNQTAEETAQLAIKNLADGDKTTQDALVGTLTTAATAAGTAKTTADTAQTTASTAKTTADSAYDAQVTVAAGTATGLAADLTAIATLRTTAATATTALNTANTGLESQVTLIDTKKAEVDAATALHLAAIVTCKETEFDKYAATLAAAEATRATNISTIQALVDGATKPTAGSAGARCEKAMSNGTFRPRRDEATCAEGLCCGAAKIPVGKAVMIIETCQAKDAATYSYAKPRAPMATTMPTGTDYPFTCIEGAQKLAAAASALAAAVYMLA